MAFPFFGGDDKKEKEKKQKQRRAEEGRERERRANNYTLPALHPTSYSRDATGCVVPAGTPSSGQPTPGAASTTAGGYSMTEVSGIDVNAGPIDPMASYRGTLYPAMLIHLPHTLCRVVYPRVRVYS
ncbi:hypothetical protein KIPB_014373 [Kipferlia bialata]|uniref:Uncharacterized protein n=1 Tax=Kipferlia bialata TaxID=797122 RepID=A0A391P2M4_9EUKA|nr:hypothetical protein KIPB_014373 [Kipferlia bialata]|eukprot:g14373.t1